MRTGGKLTFVLSDHHGTGTTQVTSDAAQSVTRRKTTIFGAPRGTQPAAWQGDKGFVGGTRDADTSLTHLGAREYDPAIGRFISVDPVMVLDEPQQAHGYSYASNNPVAQADPSGLCAEMDCPSRPSPDHENTTPGHVPGPPKLTLSGEVKQAEGRKAREQYRCKGFDCEMVDQPARWCQQNPLVCNIVMAGPEIERSAKKAWELEKELLGVADFQRCRGGDLEACIDVTKDAILMSKVRLLGKVIGEVGDALKSTPGGCKCFLAGTDVKMADGSTKHINKIKVGDEVLATNPLTGQTGARKVTRLIVTDNDKHFNEVTIATARGPKKLTATHEHPFWSPSEKQWIKAGELKPGMTLLTDQGTTVAVDGNRAFTKRARTYNLTVDDLHTYYVLAGETPVLVHNSNCNLFDGDGWQHVLDEHVDGSPGVTQGNTTFSNYMDLDEIGELIEDASKTPGRRNTPDAAGRPRDGTIHTHDFDYPVGSRGETSVEVILNPDGSLRTAYPR
jgi:RHS repeat-associated protein